MADGLVKQEYGDSIRVTALTLLVIYKGSQSAQRGGRSPDIEIEIVYRRYGL
jgi:hypothetical protein